MTEPQTRDLITDEARHARGHTPLLRPLRLRRLHRQADLAPGPHPDRRPHKCTTVDYLFPWAGRQGRHCRPSRATPGRSRRGRERGLLRHEQLERGAGRPHPGRRADPVTGLGPDVTVTLDGTYAKEGLRTGRQANDPANYDIVTSRCRHHPSYLSAEDGTDDDPSPFPAMTDAN